MRALLLSGLMLAMLTAASEAQTNAPPTGQQVTSGTRPAHAEPFPRPPNTIEIEARLGASNEAFGVTVYLPPGRGPFPVVVFAHSANPPSRNAPNWANTAAPILGAGAAFAVYDPPGVGDRAGEWRENAPMSEVPANIIAVVDAIATDRRFRGQKIGVMGISRGGWTAPLAARQSPRIEFLVAVSAPSVSPNEANIYQRGEELLDDGFTQAEVNEIAAFRRVIWDYYGSGQAFDRAEQVWRQASQRPWFARLRLRSEIPRPDEITGLNFAYYREGVYDPTVTLSGLNIPILVVLGDADRHIPVDASLMNWRRALAVNPHRDSQIVLLPRAGHAMRLVADQEQMSAVQGGHSVLTAAPPHPAFAPLLTSWIARQARETSDD